LLRDKFSYVGAIDVSLAGHLYRSLIRANRASKSDFLKAQLLRARWMLLSICDPIVEVPIDENGKTLWMHFSHTMPLVRSVNRFYDSIFDRLAQNILDFESKFIMIDVGANIGDTVALVRHGENCRFLCVEGDKRHFALLERNTASVPNVTRVCTLVSDQNGTADYSMHEHHGTSYIVEGNSGKIATRTIDDVIAEYPEFNETSLLKIDTDGFDLKVIRGAKRLLAERTPALIFELSPRHYVKAGNEEPRLAVKQLRDIGYDLIAVYSSSGILMLAVDISDPSSIDSVVQLINYAHFDGRYFDIVAFHRSKSAQYNAFLTNERKLFTPPDPARYALT
jgi:FkbM family methyltransferase